MNGGTPIVFAHTAVKIPELPQKLNHQQRLITVGSCFADEIGIWLKHRSFSISINPTGAIYYPPALTRLLRWALEGQFPETGIIVYHKLYKDLHLHSRFDGDQERVQEQKRSKLLHLLREELTSVDWLLLTFGTSIFYEHLETGIEVANCHKLPSTDFKKKVASVADMQATVFHDLETIRKINPKIKIIFTVSPVRHVRDGMVENARSKAKLLLLCEELVNSIPDSWYFPAFEIMIDELRDYRFYADDLLHPSPQAVQWIGQKLANSLFENEAQILSEEYHTLYRALQHRPTWTHTEEYSKHLVFIKTGIQALEKKISIPELQQLFDAQFNQP